MRICGSSKRTISYIKKYSVGIIIASLLFTASSSPVSAANTNDVNIIMVGDILLHSPVEEAAVNESGEYNFDFIFDRTRKDISTSDIAIVNKEVIIGCEELGISGYPNFNAPYQVGDALVKAGFDVVCHGTNHALDRGKRELLIAVIIGKRLIRK